MPGAVAIRHPSRKISEAGKSAGISWDESSAQQFHLEGLSAVRNEADKLKDQIGAIERYVLFGSGAIYTFLVAHSNDLKSVPLANYVWWIPPTMTWLFGLRSLALRRRLKNCDSYIELAENESRVGRLCGARHWYRQKERRLQFVTAVALAVWLLTFLGTSLLAIVGSRMSFVWLLICVPIVVGSFLLKRYAESE